MNASSLRSARTRSSRDHPELARDAVHCRERDALDGLPEPFGVRTVARLARVGDGCRLESPAAEREVRDDHRGDEAERDEERQEAPHSGRLRKNATGTSAHSVNAAARRNGPENALVTARSSCSWSPPTSARHSSSSGRPASARSTSGSSPTVVRAVDLVEHVLRDTELVERRDLAVEHDGGTRANRLVAVLVERGRQHRREQQQAEDDAGVSCGERPAAVNDLVGATAERELRQAGDREPETRTRRGSAAESSTPNLRAA